MNKEQAKRLRADIRRLVRAEIEYANKGCLPTEDHLAIVHELNLMRGRVYATLRLYTKEDSNG